MKHTKLIITFLLVLISTNILCQRWTAKNIVPDSLLILKKGIYMNKNEFLNNEPSITFNFEVKNDNPNYIFHPEERNKFYVTYYDIVGSKIQLNINDIWGYYDGFGIFISFKGKPFELLYLGSISIIRYEHHYDKNVVSQAFSLYTVGSTTKSVEKRKDMYFDIRNDIIVSRKPKNFKKLISKDVEFYNKYKRDRKTHKLIKPIIYLQEFNKKHPILITKDGLRLN
jgi:hypothetical protein